MSQVVTAVAAVLFVICAAREEDRWFRLGWAVMACASLIACT
jgi:hypothetical protein